MNRTIFAFAIAGAFFYIASPLLLPVVMGGLLAVAILPAQEWLEKRKLRSKFASGLLTFCVTLLLLLPASILLYLAAKAGFRELQNLNAPAEGNWIQAFLDTPFGNTVTTILSDWYPVSRDELAGTIGDFAAALSLKAANFLGLLLAQLPGFALGLAVVVVSIYFVLVDGRVVVSFVRRNSFFTPHQTDRLVSTLEMTCRSVILASLASGMTQALIEAFACVLGGLRNVSLIAVLVFLFSFVPVIGTAPVTFGVAIHQYLIGRHSAAVILLIAAFVISLIDNLIRPLFLKGTVNLHPLVAFVAAFGGLQTIGFAGVFLGPIIAALFIALMRILSERDMDQRA